MKRGHWFHCTSDDHGLSWTATRRTPLLPSLAEPPVPRLCVSRTVAACFAAVLFRSHSPVYVYRTAAPRRAVTPRGVWDHCVTREHWLIPPAPMVLVNTIPPDAVDAAQCAIRLYHTETRRNADLWLRVAQYAVAFDVLGGTDRERGVVQRFRTIASIDDPEEFILARALSELERRRDLRRQSFVTGVG